MHLLLSLSSSAMCWTGDSLILDDSHQVNGENGSTEMKKKTKQNTCNQNHQLSYLDTPTFASSRNVE